MKSLLLKVTLGFAVSVIVGGCAVPMSISSHVDRPDLLIHYHANISERLEINQADRVHSDCSTPNCPPEIIRYEAGTLVLDFMDPRTNKLVWRGWAQNSVEDMLGNQDLMAKTIEQAVTGMLRQLPPMR